MYLDEQGNPTDNYCVRAYKNNELVYYTSTRISEDITVIDNEINFNIPVDYDSIEVKNIEQNRVINAQD